MNSIKIVFALLVVVAAAFEFDFSVFKEAEMQEFNQIGVDCSLEDCKKEVGATEECAAGELTSDELVSLHENSKTWLLGCGFTYLDLKFYRACYREAVKDEYSNSTIAICDDEFNTLATCVHTCFINKLSSDLFIKVWTLAG